MSVRLPTPRGVNAAWLPEAVFGHFIQAWPGHDATDLRLFAEGEQVRQYIEVLTAPVAASCAHAALHFIENQEQIVLVANIPQSLEPFGAKMIIAPFALDGFDDDGGDVGAALFDNPLDL